MSHTILVTGSSRGFGKLITGTLLEQGHRVAASMRDPHGRNQDAARELEQAGAVVIDLDVTSDSSVTRGVAEAISRLGSLDVVVNNAGIGVLGVQEAFTVEDFKRLFELNVFGVQRVSRAVTPHMRERGSGLLLLISSILGRMTVSFYGPYNASKWAVEAMMENYRMELGPFGVDACIVEPGGFPTSFMDSLLRPADADRVQQLGEFGQAAPQAFFDAFEQALAGNPAQDPQLVADAVAHVIGMPAGTRPMRTVVDRMGMGAAVQPYNEHLEQVMDGVFQAFGMSDMRGVRA